MLSIELPSLSESHADFSNFDCSAFTLLGKRLLNIVEVRKGPHGNIHWLGWHGESCVVAFPQVVHVLLQDVKAVILHDVKAVLLHGMLKTVLLNILRWSIWAVCWSWCFSSLSNLLLGRRCLEEWVRWPERPKQPSNGECPGMGDAVPRSELWFII